jgi:hypothetical protein
MSSTSLASLLAALALTALAAPACSGGSTVVDEAEGPPASAEASAAPAPSATPASTPAEAATAAPTTTTTPAAAGSKTGGASCDAAAECESGVCEGEGCGPGQGKCAEKNRKCTLDLRQYCGCDGKTFSGGGNCPKARFAKAGPCEGDPGKGPKLPFPPAPPPPT